MPGSTVEHPPCALTDAGIPALLALTRLRRLGLGGVYLVMWGCRTQAQGPAVVDLPGRITDEGLLRLAALPALETVDLRWNPGVTNEGARRFVDACANPPGWRACEVRR